MRIHRKIMGQKKDTGEQPRRKYLFQGQSEISKHWLDLDMEWVEENFSKRELQFYKRLFQTIIEGQSGITYLIFPVTFVNVKETGEIEYALHDPLVAYYQKDSNFCCFSSLASTFTASGEKNAVRKIARQIEKSLHCKYQVYKDSIVFDNAIMSDQVRNPGEQRLHCNIKKRKKEAI